MGARRRFRRGTFDGARRPGRRGARRGAARRAADARGPGGGRHRRGARQLPGPALRRRAGVDHADHRRRLQRLQALLIADPLVESLLLSTTCTRSTSAPGSGARSGGSGSGRSCSASTTKAWRTSGSATAAGSPASQADVEQAVADAAPETTGVRIRAARGTAAADRSPPAGCCMTSADVGGRLPVASGSPRGRPACGASPLRPAPEGTGAPDERCEMCGERFGERAPAHRRPGTAVDRLRLHGLRAAVHPAGRPVPDRARPGPP